MQSQPETNSASPAAGPREPRSYAAFRVAGALLVLTAIATLVSVVTRVASGADQPTLLESLGAIAANKELYSIGGIARFVSGVTLIAGAGYVLKIWANGGRWCAPTVPFILIASGGFTAVSGVCAIGLVFAAEGANDAFLTGVVGQSPVDRSTEVLAFLRWFTGKVGFAVAGLALMGAAGYHWRVGGRLKYFAIASVVIGIAMQFIWIDAATPVHRISGIAFLAWLLAMGGMLVLGRVEGRLLAPERRVMPQRL